MLIFLTGRQQRLALIDVTAAATLQKFLHIIGPNASKQFKAFE